MPTPQPDALRRAATLAAAGLLATLPACSAPTPPATSVAAQATPATPAAPAAPTTPAVAEALTSATPPAPATQIPEPGQTRRVGGDLAATITGRSGNYRSGSLRIDTELPEGYPPPTPPNAIDLKTYPAVRRASISSQALNTRGPDTGMNRAFMPLFRHIQRHGIAMTSPVEMDYRDVPTPTATNTNTNAPANPAPADALRASADWSMAFLYRTPDLHPTGRDGTVDITDAPPITVISVGLRGNYSTALTQQGMEQIETWLSNNPQWTPAGPWRSLFYNGPQLMFTNKWAEVQLPVKPAE